MKKDKLLIAGPWIGEFGWELFAWQGYVRALSEKFDQTICISSPHSKFIYEDFCDEFLSFTPMDKGGYKDSFFRTDFKMNKKILLDILKQSKIDIKQKNTTLFVPKRIGDPPRTHFSEPMNLAQYSLSPKYVKFADNKNKEKTVLVHARNRKLRSKDNWSVEKWEELVSLLKEIDLSVISIGLKKEAMHIPGTEDKRECDQEELLKIISSSECIFGQSSGAMHLSTLCGCPQVVWSDMYNFDRYTKNWNPFDVDVLFLAEQEWQPEVKYIFEKFVEWRKTNGA